MQVLVISGFLGAGKTTFIKELLKRTGIYAVVLENEYGETDLDSRSVNQTGDLQVLEFMEGCVCCTKKDSFANTILSISAALDPAYLVVEPTGIGKLSNILDNVMRVSYERISLLEPVTIVSPRGFYAHMRDEAEICTDQISHASVIVLSKLTGEDPDVLDDVCGKISEINPGADIIRVPYEEMPDEWWKNLFLLEAVSGAGKPSGTGNAAGNGTQTQPGTGDAGSDSNTEDGFMQVSVKNGSFSGVAGLVLFLEDTIRGTFGYVERVKGIVQTGQEWMRFEVSDGMYAVTADVPENEQHAQCVVIGKQLEEDKIRHRLHEGPVRMRAGVPQR